MSESKFTVVDYVVFALSLALSAAIGIYYGCSGGKQKTTSEFLFGDRNMRLFPVAMSLVASGTSAIGILGSTSETYLYGGQYSIEVLTVFVAAPVTAAVYLPLFFKLKLSSIYEYLELRFNKSLRCIASMIYLFQTLMFLAPCLYTPASALSQVTGLPYWTTMIGSGSVCILYTLFGGLKAVVLTDTIQQIFVFVGLLAVVIQGCLDLGGLNNIWHTAENGGRTIFFDFTVDPRYLYSFWSIVIGGTFTWLSFYACDQCMVQRYLSVPSLRQAQCAILLTIVMYLLLKVLYLLCGLIVFTKYSNCDPKLAGRINKYDQILPLFVVDSLNNIPGIAGLFVAAVYSASLSAISSGLNAIATVILKDIVSPLKMHFWNLSINEKEGAFISKIAVFLFGIITLGLSLIFPLLERTLIQLISSLYGLTCGTFLGIFTLGMFFYYPNSLGTISGAILSLCLLSWIMIGSFAINSSVLPTISLRTDGCPTLLPITAANFSDVSGGTLKYGIKGLYQISVFHYPLVGFFSTVIIGFIGSMIFGCFQKEHVDPQLVYPLFQNIKKSFQRRLNQTQSRSNLMESLSYSTKDFCEEVKDEDWQKDCLTTSNQKVSVAIINSKKSENIESSVL